MSSVVARVKIMAGLNIAEKRLPQDGRISLKIAGRAIDMRVSTIPTSRDTSDRDAPACTRPRCCSTCTDLGFAERDFT